MFFTIFFNKILIEASVEAEIIANETEIAEDVDEVLSNTESVEIADAENPEEEKEI